MAKLHRRTVRQGAPLTDTITMMKRDRRVPVSIVACPSCGAAVDAPCTTLDGRPSKKVHHIARRRMALRAERGEA